MADTRILHTDREIDFFRECKANGLDKAKSDWITEYIREKLATSTNPKELIGEADNKLKEFLAGIREVNNAQRDLIKTERKAKPKA